MEECNFSVSNWLENSGLEEDLQKKIIILHWEAPKKMQEVYNMHISEDECMIKAKIVIVVGEK